MAALIVAGFISSPLARAQSELITSLGSSATAAGLQNVIGIKFTVGSEALTVTQLGLFDKAGGALHGGEKVGLFDSTGSLVGPSLSYTSSDGVGAAAKTFVYKDLGTPISLTAGATYTLAGLFTGSDAYITGASDMGVTPDVTLVTASLFGFSSTLVRPTSDGLGAGPYLATSLTFTAVPEPSLYATMAGAGALGFVLWRRKRAAR